MRATSFDCSVAGKNHWMGRLMSPLADGVSPIVLGATRVPERDDRCACTGK